jgi:propionate CoA-transferase
MGTMNPLLFEPGPMGLREALFSRPVSERIAYDAQREILFINFQGLALKSEADLAEVGNAVERCCGPIGRRVKVIVNYDGFSVPGHLMDSYAELVRELCDRFYTEVTRYTSSAFLRLKLGSTFVTHQVNPHLFETREEATRFLETSNAGKSES